MVEDSVTFIEGTGPISIELPSDACLYVLTYLRVRYEGPCPVIGGRFNIRDLRLAGTIADMSDGTAERRRDIAQDFAGRAFELYRRLPRVHPLSAWRLNRVRRYVENRIEQRMSLEELAEVAGFSRAHFAATFKAATSMSVHEFILRCRIQMAAKLLATTELSLVDISLRAGFQNQAHFTTVFKKFTSATPGRWRGANRRAEPRSIFTIDSPTPPAPRRPDPAAHNALNLH
jgi:AraC-like DNA-binding protein